MKRGIVYSRDIESGTLEKADTGEYVDAKALYLNKFNDRLRAIKQ